jgi:uncharacterized protein with HEPN domain
MSKRDPRLFMTDVLEAIEKIEHYTSGLTFDQFEANEMVLDAVVRNLEIIGEATRCIPATLRERYTQIEWSRVVGFRNIVMPTLLWTWRLCGRLPHTGVRVLVVPSRKESYRESPSLQLVHTCDTIRRVAGVSPNRWPYRSRKVRHQRKDCRGNLLRCAPSFFDAGALGSGYSQRARLSGPKRIRYTCRYRSKSVTSSVKRSTKKRTFAILTGSSNLVRSAA